MGRDNKAVSLPALEPTLIPDPDHRAAFRALLHKALDIRSSDRVLTIIDETFEEFFPALTAELLAVPTLATTVVLPQSWQHHFSNSTPAHRSTSVPEPLVAAIDRSTTIMSFLAADTRTLPIRRALLDLNRPKDSRFAHVPGLTRQVLDLVGKTDFKRIYEECELLAWYLGKSNNAEITTIDPSESTHTLRLRLGGWDNEPLMSPGVILPGSWGNFPPGEVFCCPDPESAEGEICITGSLPGVIFNPGEGVLLSFANGRLCNWKAINSVLADTFFSDHTRLAEQREDCNWDVLCELGIGLNTAITRLTGNPLFDEKAARTLHIALGENTAFGHDNHAQVHLDLVTNVSSLKLEDVEMFRDGLLDIEDLGARRKASSSFSPMPDSSCRIRVDDSQVHEEQQRLRRRLYKGQRVGLVDMADDQTAYALVALCTIIKAYEVPVRIADVLNDIPQVRGYSTEHLLTILNHYRCLDVIS
jgi:hypothetical protein